jgi:hypothetical protein
LPNPKWTIPTEAADRSYDGTGTPVIVGRVSALSATIATSQV